MKYAIALALLVVTSAAQTQSAREYTSIGPGVGSCGTWTADTLNSHSFNMNRAWITGFFTGYNRYGRQPGGNITQNVDASGWTAAVDRYCRDHPMKTIEDAAADVIRQLSTAR